MNQHICNILLVTTIVLVFSSCGGNKSYLERKTGIKFPKEVETLEEKDNFKWAAISVYMLRQEDIEDFIIENSLTKYTNTRELIIVGNKMLQPENRDYNAASNELYTRIDGNEDMNWIHILDKKRGKYWCAIGYMGYVKPDH